MALTIITRTEWGARSPDPSPFPITTWANRTGFVVHYSAASKTQSVRSIQNYQMDNNNWRDIGYNFLVDYQGNIYEGCQGTWLAIGAHVANHNTSNVGVCAIGTDLAITEIQKRSIRLLYDEANRRAGKTLHKRYHSGMEGASTACPGDRLRTWVQSGMPMPNLEDEVTQDELVAAVVVGIHSALDQAANRSTPTGRQMDDDLETVFSKLNTVYEVVSSGTLQSTIISGVLNGLGTKPTADIVEALQAVMTPEKLAELKAAL